MGPVPIDDEDLQRRFAFHPAGDQSTKDAHEAVRDAALQFAREIVDLAPPGREASLAVTKIEEAMMFANAAIARAGGPRT